MQVLVTGATGFLGSYLVSRLVQRGDKVRALVRKTSKVDQLLKQGVDVVCGDLRDKESLRRAVEGVDVVYHAGAVTSGSREEYENSTIKGTEWMLGLSFEAGIKRFVHVSTIAVYRVYEVERNSTVNENCPTEDMPEKVGLYTYSKVEAEKLAWRFYRKGLPVVVIRPGLIYGPRGKVLFPHIGFPIKAKLFVIVGKGENLLPLTYAENVAEAIVLAGTREGAVGQAYNIVDDGEITQREYLKNYMAGTHTSFFTISLPFAPMLLAIKLLERTKSLGILGKSPSPSKYGVISKYKSLRFDTSKVKRELDWQPKMTMEEGLKRTFKWCNDGRRTN